MKFQLWAKKAFVLLICHLFYSPVFMNLDETQLSKIHEALRLVLTTDVGVHPALFFTVLVQQGSKSYKIDKELAQNIIAELAKSVVKYVTKVSGKPCCFNYSKIENSNYSGYELESLSKGSVRRLFLQSIYHRDSQASQNILAKREIIFGKLDEFNERIKKCGLTFVTNPLMSFDERSSNRIDLKKAWECVNAAVKPYLDIFNNFIDFEVSAVIEPLLKELQKLRIGLDDAVITDSNKTIESSFLELSRLLEHVIVISTVDSWMSELHDYLARLAKLGKLDKDQRLELVQAAKLLSVYRFIVINWNLLLLCQLVCEVEILLSLLKKERARLNLDNLNVGEKEAADDIVDAAPKPDDVKEKDKDAEVSKIKAMLEAAEKERDSHKERAENLGMAFSKKGKEFDKLKKDFDEYKKAKS